MGGFRFLFAPDFARPLVVSARDAAQLVRALWAILRQRWKTGEGLTGAGTSPADWFRPALFPGVLVGLFGASMAGLGVAGLLAERAVAQTIDPGLFSETDRATREVLGFLGDFDVARYAVLGDMLFVFNGGVLVLAGALLIYYTVSGTLDTAREGRWGFGSWEIVRIVAAVALMAPLPGGMNGAQHMVLGLAYLGGDFANAVWKPFSREVLAKGRPIVPRPKEAAVRATIARTLLIETCRYVANDSARRAGDEPYVVIREERVRAGDGSPASAIVASIYHYNGAGRGLPKDLCGSIRFGGLAAKDAQLTAALGHRAALEGLAGEVRRVAAELGAHYVPGSPSYGQPLPDVEAELVKADLAGVYGAIVDAALRRAVPEEQAALERVVAADMERASWLSAAAFFNTIAYRIGTFQAAAHNIPSVALPLASLGEWSKPADAAVQGLTAALEGARAYSPMISSSVLGSAGSVSGSAGGGSSSLVGGVFDMIDLDSVTIADSGNPIADLASLGHSLITASLLGIGALSAAAVISGRLKLVQLDVFDSMWKVGDAFVSLILGILLIAGVVLAYLLPAVPFIRFLFGILGWIISVVVAVLAVTVFAAAHVTRGDGDRLATSATRQGWLFLPALVLRPVLMLFGLILGYFVFLATIGVFNAAWLPQMRDAAGSESLGVIGYLAMLTIYIMIAYGLINASFKLIDLLPAVVLEWIGGRASGEGEGADRVLGTVGGGVARLGGLRIGSRLGRGPRPPGSAP